MQYMNNYRAPTAAERAERERERAEREAQVRMKNNRLGLAIFQASWIMVFVCLVVVNWQMGFSPGWRPDDLTRPDALLPTIATVALLVSTWLARQAWKTLEGGMVARFLSGWGAAIGLGTLFFVIMLMQFFTLPAATEGTEYVQMYRLMIGYHAVHAVVIGLMMARVWRQVRAGEIQPGQVWPVEASTKLWYFVTVAWLMFYVVLYWV